jgi:hypothetical protein
LRDWENRSLRPSEPQKSAIGARALETVKAIISFFVFSYFRAFVTIFSFFGLKVAGVPMAFPASSCSNAYALSIILYESEIPELWNWGMGATKDPGISL